MALKQIRLELARTDGFPEGSDRHGYEFVAPLTEAGHIDPVEWCSSKKSCTVRRFWGGAADEAGHLQHLGHGWRFDYERPGTGDDEPFFKLDKHVLTPGAYVSITEHDGIQRPFRVVSVTPMLKTASA